MKAILRCYPEPTPEHVCWKLHPVDWPQYPISDNWKHESEANARASAKLAAGRLKIEIVEERK